MTRSDFMEEVVKTYFQQNCSTVSEAIDITQKKLAISDIQFKNWFGRDKSEKVDSGRRDICKA